MTLCYDFCMSNRKQSSASNTVWTVRGVAHETRSAVAVAAKRAGQSVGEWTTRAVMDAITTQTGNRNVPAHRVEDVLAKVVERLEALEKNSCSLPKEMFSAAIASFTFLTYAA